MKEHLSSVLSQSVTDAGFEGPGLTPLNFCVLHPPGAVITGAFGASPGLQKRLMKIMMEVR